MARTGRCVVACAVLATLSTLGCSDGTPAAAGGGDGGSGEARDGGQRSPDAQVPGPLGEGGVAAFDVLPALRRVDWSRTGVPGGVPHRTTGCATLDAAAYGDGAKDATAAITAAIRACPEGEVVRLTAGKFRLDGRVEFGFHSNVTLRGAGPDKTVLVARGEAIFVGGNSCWPDHCRPKGKITGGTHKGSTELALSSVEGLAVGTMIFIDRADAPSGPGDPTDADLVHSPSGGTRLIRQLAMITAVRGDAVTIDPPLLWDYSSSPGLGYFPQIIRGAGVEDLAVDHSQGGSGASVSFDQAFGCWMRNVTSTKPGGYHSIDSDSLRCEIRDSLFDDSKQYGANNAGVALYGANTGWKIENNVFHRNFPGVELQNGSSGNFIGYNYGYDVRTGAELAGADCNDNHGPHDMMNLWEGNSGEQFQSDGYHGSGSHGTLFRNHFRATSANTSMNLKAIGLNRWAYYYSVIGNVLGSPGFPASGAYQMAKDGYSYAIPTIYHLGYPNMGNNGFSSFDGKSPGGLDAKVAATLLRYKNYDFFHKGTVTDSAGLADAPLPPSLRYSGRPEWWPVDLPFPPFGPDVPGLVGKLPAQIRFERGAP